MSFSLQLIDWCVCLVVLGSSIFLGLYLAIRKKSSVDSAHFFLADRSLSWPLVGASLFATNIGAEHLVGLSGDSYRYGLSAGTVELTTCICVGFAAAFLYPFYIRNRVFTTPEFLETRYHPAARILFSALMLVISITTKMAFHLYAGALVLRGLLGWDVMTVVWVMGASGRVCDDHRRIYCYRIHRFDSDRHHYSRLHRNGAHRVAQGWRMARTCLARASGNAYPSSLR